MISRTTFFTFTSFSSLLPHPQQKARRQEKHARWSEVVIRAAHFGRGSARRRGVSGSSRRERNGQHFHNAVQQALHDLLLAEGVVWCGSNPRPSRQPLRQQREQQRPRPSPAPPLAENGPRKRFPVPSCYPIWLSTMPGLRQETDDASPRSPRQTRRRARQGAASCARPPRPWGPAAPRPTPHRGQHARRFEDRLEGISSCTHKRTHRKSGPYFK